MEFRPSKQRDFQCFACATHASPNSDRHYRAAIKSCRKKGKKSQDTKDLSAGSKRNVKKIYCPDEIDYFPR